jgi:predicted aspartyl protease
MGRLFVNVTVGNAVDRAKSLDCEVLIDTGASHLVLPAAWRPRLGDLETLSTLPAEMATGETVLAEVCGPVRLEVEGFRPISTEVMFIEMQPIDGRYEPLLGYIPLEQIPVIVDLKSHRLMSVPADLR